MADALPEKVLESAARPAEVARQKFDLERRGFDQAQVRSYLIAISEALADAQTREAEIRTRLGKAIRRAETAEAKVRDQPTGDPSELTRQIGDEVTSVLDAARAAGEQRVATAETSAAQILANAKTEADQVRAAAETIMDERRAEADTAAAEIVTTAKAEADQIRGKAQADADAMRANAAEIMTRASDEGDALVAEAEAARLQILEDMDRRRRHARAQVERLRVGRDRLLRSYDVVRRTLDESTTELKSSLAEAKVMGDTAARRVGSEPPASSAQLEAELADARLIAAPSSKPKPKPTRSGPRAKSGAGAIEARPAPGPPVPQPGSSTPALPKVDMGIRAFSEEVAPTPRRPKAPESRPTGVGDPTVPKPPAVAPQIKPDLAPGSPGGAQTDAQMDSAETAPTETGVVNRAAADERRPDTPSEPEGTEVGDVVVLAEAGSDQADQADQADVEYDQVDDAEFAELVDEDLSIIVAEDEVEEVTAVPLDSEPSPADAGNAGEPDATPENAAGEADEASPAGVESSDQDESGAAAGIFAALRERGNPTQPAETPDNPDTPAAAAPRPTKAEAAQARRHAKEMGRQRDAIVAALTVDIEKRLKRALADEQNDLLAGIRTAGRKPVELLSIVGTTDDHLRRYVVAINEVASMAYGAGAALVEEEPAVGALPAGAVEELLTGDVVEPLRSRLAELDRDQGDTSGAAVESVRAFYRQRKLDSLNDAAGGLASLLVTAGVCDALPEDSGLPW